jgi:hypothetical protein
VRSGLVVDLQVQPLGSDESEEQVVEIQAMPAEHAPRAHRA